MKLKIYIALSLVTMVQYQLLAQCLPNGITTNPDNPCNTQFRGFTNNFFDWRTVLFTTNSDDNPNPVVSPFHYADNANSGSIIKKTFNGIRK